MQAVRTIGLDIAKSVFQIHGVDATGNVIVCRKLKRRYVLPSLPEATAVPRWYRSLRLIASLVARTAGSANLREALCQATQDPCCRR